MSEEKSQYEKLGVDTSKAMVREIFSDDDGKSPFPYSWVKIKPDMWQPKNFVMTMHGDGVGSLTLTRLFCYFETGDPAYLRGDIVNAFEMNMGDVAASGFVEKVVECDIINLNAFNIPKEVILRAKRDALAEVVQLYARFGFPVARGQLRPIRVQAMGGETADLPDQTPSCILDVSFFSRMHKRHVIAGNTQPDDEIFGIPSWGKAVWEKEENSGMMSNGGTHSRIYMLHPDYAGKYPFLVSPHNPLQGPFRIDEHVSELGMSVGKALTSPTRHVGIIIKMVIDELNKLKARHLLHGIALVSGGGMKKIVNLGSGLRYTMKLKNEMIAPLFLLIQKTSEETWRNMLKSYNCGTCLQFVGSPEGEVLKKAIAAVCQRIGLKSYRLGKCSRTKRKDGKNEVVIFDPWGDKHYYND